MKRWLKRILHLIGVVLIAALAGWYGLPWLVPLPDSLKTPLTPSTRFVSAEGQPLRLLLTDKGDRVFQVLRYEDIPAHLIHATLAAEDKRFFSHGGVDLLAILRAAKDNLTSGRIVSGASTLHQQLVKVASERAYKRSWKVKLLEALQARRLAMSWSHETVLAEYLNRVSYGNLLTGCISAAQGYLDKPLSDLSPAEYALLASLPQSPSRFNPFRGLDKVRPRQQYVLKRMAALGWLSGDELRVALAETLRVQRFQGGFAAPHAVAMLPFHPGEEVQTTLKLPLQKQVETIIAQRLAALRDRHVTQAAAVVIENTTGHILALAGSRDFFALDGGQINGAWAPHSPGSTIKPFTYLLALERGASPATLIADLPVDYTTSTGNYRPENYAHKLYGPVTYRQALGNSLNISAVKVLQRIGGPEVLLKKLQAVGMTTLNDEADHYGLGLTIGNAPVRLVELANAYACLARLGQFKPWTLQPHHEPFPDTTVFDPTLCYVLADILSDNRARELTFGRHSPLRLPFPAAVKTGTSTSYRDNWCVGFTPEFTVTVWTGNFDNTPMNNVSGVTGAAPIWRDIFLDLHQRYGVSWYPQPPGLVHARIDPRNGKRLTPQSPPVRLSRDEIFLPERLPAPATPADYDALGRAILPLEYAAWVKSADNWMGDLVTVSPSEAPRLWRIAHPVPGTVIHLDPDIPGEGRRLILQTEPPQSVIWTSETLHITQENGSAMAELVPGQHTLQAKDQATQETRSTFIIVHPQ